MPTESAFFLAGLLFLAAALGYVFARFGDDEDEGRSAGATEYLRGLKFLLKEQPDQAVEAFTKATGLDEESLETHFALGQLFRRRGEVERAIRVHRDLMERPGLNRDQQEDARFALAQDYLSAGLFDRAESLFNDLRESARFRLEALGQLIRLHEMTREWDRAIELHRELERTDATMSKTGTIGHYWCELAEQARRERKPERAAELLQEAEKCRPETVRVALIRGGLAEDAGDYPAASASYQRVAQKEPALLMDVIPRLWAVSRAGSRQEQFSEFLRDLIQQNPKASRAIAMAAIFDPGLDDPMSLQCLWDMVSGDRTLKALVDADRLGIASQEDRYKALERIRSALREVATKGRTYRCYECGYGSMTLQWQCPGCRAWDTVRPQVRLTFESAER